MEKEEEDTPTSSTEEKEENPPFDPLYLCSYAGLWQFNEDDQTQDDAYRRDMLAALSILVTEEDTMEAAMVRLGTQVSLLCSFLKTWSEKKVVVGEDGNEGRDGEKSKAFQTNQRKKQKKVEWAKRLRDVIWYMGGEDMQSREMMGITFLCSFDHFHWWHTCLAEWWTQGEISTPAWNGLQTSLAFAMKQYPGL